ncbi:hypothetical protein FS749_004616 [Ceratobasidium sp. UAMH 11750]|nr:hypothetical protein FS749_004616 [Ceratobasidium sp. UAMH 11750]
MPSSTPESSQGGRSERSNQSRGHPRSRDDSPASDAGPRKRRPIVLSAKRKTTDEYGVAARMVTRTIDMNWEPFEVVNAGIRLMALDDQDEVDAMVDSASERERPLYDIFLKLCDRIPGLEDSDDWDDVRRRAVCLDVESAGELASDARNLPTRGFSPSASE